jgi:hypothetical protein
MSTALSLASVRAAVDTPSDLLEQPGVGPIIAATLLCAWSHLGRVRSEAAFAMLAGVAPIPANSGQTTNRFRLNRYGDRQLNRALHTVVISRLRHDKNAQVYSERRTAEGKTPPGDQKVLERYVAVSYVLYSSTLRPTIESPGESSAKSLSHRRPSGEPFASPKYHKDERRHVTGDQGSGPLF